MWGCVDEVGMGDQRGRKTNGRAVQRSDEDLGVRVKGVGDVEVVGHKSAKRPFTTVLRFRGRKCIHIGAAAPAVDLLA